MTPRPIRIGLDVDGVLANFYPLYEDLIVELTGRNLFPPRTDPFEPPPVWNWPEHYGYKAKELSASVWAHIKSHGSFWSNAHPFPKAAALVDFCYAEADENVYFITDRPGAYAKAHTQRWLRETFPGEGFSVLISQPGKKGLLVEPLGLTHFVEDNREHAVAVAAFGAKSYLLDRPYNQGPAQGVTRVKDISELLGVMRDDLRGR
jgi:uncharacterized HAD superfamily protein